MSRSGGPCKAKEGIRHSYHTASGRSKHGEPPDRQIPSLSMVQPCRRSAHQKAAGETRPCHFSCKRLPEGTTQCGSRIVPSNATSGGSSNGSGSGSDRCLGSFGCNNRRRSRSKCPRLFFTGEFSTLCRSWLRPLVAARFPRLRRTIFLHLCSRLPMPRARPPGAHIRELGLRSQGSLSVQ